MGALFEEEEVEEEEEEEEEEVSTEAPPPPPPLLSSVLLRSSSSLLLSSSILALAICAFVLLFLFPFTTTLDLIDMGPPAFPLSTFVFTVLGLPLFLLTTLAAAAGLKIT